MARGFANGLATKRLRTAALTAVMTVLLLVPATWSGAAPSGGTAASAPRALSAPNRDIVAGVNAERARRGLSPLSVSARLSRDSTRWASRVIRSDQFLHSAPESRGRGEVGEIMAFTRGKPTRERARVIVRAWMRSKVHRDAILNPRYRHVGIGARTGRFRGRTQTIWVVRLAL